MSAKKARSSASETGLSSGSGVTVHTGGYPHFTSLSDSRVRSITVRRPATALIALGATLGVGATALAQSGEDRLSIDLQDGCLNRSRVVLRITPPSGDPISTLTVYANGREQLELSGLTGEARMTVRLTSQRGRVTVNGETVGGRRRGALARLPPLRTEPATPRAAAQHAARTSPSRRSAAAARVS